MVGVSEASLCVLLHLLVGRTLLGWLRYRRTWLVPSVERGGCLNDFSLPQSTAIPSIGWMHEDVWNGAAEYQNGHCHFGSRQQP